MKEKNVIEKDMTPKLIGETYLRKVSENSHQRYTYGLYECQYCGTQWECRTTVINRGVTKSCGCQKGVRHMGCIIIGCMALGLIC